MDRLRYDLIAATHSLAALAASSAPETAPTYPANMDRLRYDLIAATHSLARLLIRLQDVEGSRPLFDPCALTIAHLQPASTWLDGCTPNTSISAPIHRIPQVMCRLLAMVRQADPPDAAEAVLTLQAVNGDGMEWSSRVRAFAARHGIELAPKPLNAQGYWPVKDAVLRGG